MRSVSSSHCRPHRHLVYQVNSSYASFYHIPHSPPIPAMSGPPYQNVLPPIIGHNPASGSYVPAPISVSNAEFMNNGLPLPIGSPGHPQIPMAPPVDTMRAYRACLNCRNRKSKCDLDPNGGRPVSVVFCCLKIANKLELRVRHQISLLSNARACGIPQMIVKACSKAVYSIDKLES